MNILTFVILFSCIFWLFGFSITRMIADVEKNEFKIKLVGVIIITILTIFVGSGLLGMFNTFCTEKTENYMVVTDPVYSLMSDISNNGKYIYYKDGTDIKRISEKSVAIKTGVSHLEVNVKKFGIFIDKDYVLYVKD